MRHSKQFERRLGFLPLIIALVSLTALGQPGPPASSSQEGGFAGRLKERPQGEKPHPVRNDVAQPGDEVVTLRYFRIKKGMFDQFLRASVEGVWPYFEKIGVRVIGMWQVIDAEGTGSGPQAKKEFDEVYLSTRYASVDHWKATRETVGLGGNGPDWEKCKAALDVRQSLTLSTNVTFLKGRMAPGGPYYMPALNEIYEKKGPK